MKLKKIIQNINLYNIKLYLEGSYKEFIINQYQKIFPQKNHKEKLIKDTIVLLPNNIQDALTKAASCPECYFNNEMKCCGCNFTKAILTDKKCKHGNF